MHSEIQMTILNYILFSKNTFDYSEIKIILSGTNFIVSRKSRKGPITNNMV